MINLNKLRGFFGKPDDDQAGSDQPKPSVEEQKLAELVDNLKKREKDLDKRLQSMDEKESFLREKESRLESKEEKVRSQEKKLSELYEQEVDKLEELADLSSEEAKSELKKRVEKNLTEWKSKKIRETKEAIKAEEDELAKEIVLDSIRHGVVDWVAEYTVSTIQLKNEEVKGRIIGREGRNIRAFERETGVDLELDETNTIRLSSFDPIRREIAKRALKKLIKDARIQPSRIEEIVEQTRKQMNKVLMEEGKKICQGVYHLPADLVRLIGKFKYRFSHGQNLAQHTIEETKIGVQMAHDLNADVKTVRLGCLLHDIGKVIEDEGSHVDLGVDLLKRYQLPQEVIATVAEHHEDKPFSSPESIIVWVADAASGSRPGARYEAHEKYLERMENIEEIVSSFQGGADVACYQAGREVRIIVDPEKISDDELTVLVHNIASQLEEETKWAGQIKVTAIRETRAAAKSPIDREEISR
jgi:ribonuclease Y